MGDSPIYLQFSEKDFTLRTLTHHLRLCDDIEVDSDTSREYGVNRKSVLTKLICSGTLVPDIMHDVVEGVLQYETKIVLIHLIQSCHYFTLKHLNYLIGCVNLSFMEVSSRPTEISLGDDKLKQNGNFTYLVTPYDSVINIKRQRSIGWNFHDCQFNPRSSEH